MLEIMNLRQAILLSSLTLVVFLSTHCSYDPNDPDTSNFVGKWGIDNTNSRRPDERPIMRTTSIYANHMEYSQGNGPMGVQGTWRTGSFQAPAKDGSGEIEAAKIINPEEIEVHLAAFIAGSKEVVTLYKIQGDDAEMKAIAAKYTQSVSYPPPAGIIAIGMTEYQLLTLPWKARQIINPQYEYHLEGYEDGNSISEDKAIDASIYCYRSDDPRLPELRVTVRRHKVTAVNGGNG